jgi:predicted nuclease of predicted toxin-antitoxin system
VKLLLDENISARQAARLREMGYDAVAATETNLAGADDPTVRAAAIDQNRVLVTLDADFGNILRYPTIETPGVIWLRLHPPTEAAISEAIVRCLQKLATEDVSGKLVVVDADKIRVRG